MALPFAMGERSGNAVIETYLRLRNEPMVYILEVKTRNGLTSLSVHESQGKAGTSLEHLREDCPEDDEIVFSSIREAAGYFVPNGFNKGPTEAGAIISGIKAIVDEFNEKNASLGVEIVTAGPMRLRIGDVVFQVQPDSEKQILARLAESFTLPGEDAADEGGAASN